VFQCFEMSRYNDLASDSSLRTTLDGRNADALKKFVALLPGVTLKAPRKGELIEALISLTNIRPARATIFVVNGGRMTSSSSADMMA